MSKLESYSIRNRENKKMPLEYDNFPVKLKNQIIHIWRNFMNKNSVPESISETAWGHIHNKLAEIHGEKELHPQYDFMGAKYYQIFRVTEYFEKVTDINSLLDIVEVSFAILTNIETVIRDNFPNNYTPFSYTIDQAINDLNDRFNVNRIGYELKNGIIIKIDKELLHKEIVDATLNLTDNHLYENTNDEFISALEHFKFKRNKECLTDCLKSFETTLKIICKENSWKYDEDRDTASSLIDICITNGLFPKYLLSEFTSLVNLLKSGSATIRNKNSAHGQGAKKISVPKHLASFMIYLTGSTINFIIESNNKKVSTQ